MRIAIVHDFLLQMGGAEKVVDVLHEMFPQAPIFTSAYDPEAMPSYYKTWDIRTTFLQRLWMKRKTSRLMLLFYPIAFESLDLSEFDLVISSSSAFAKGIVTRPHTTHVCYTHTPMRYAWTTRRYVENERLNPVVRAAIFSAAHYLRMWDYTASARVDHYLANSSAVARRIQKYYRRPSQIIYPPVDTTRFHMADEVGDYSIIVSRFAPYKRLDLAVEAFSRLKRKLKVVGSGRQMLDLQKKAGPSVEFMGHVNDRELCTLLARAKAFIMPGEEDFGIAPVEANASGRPVIAYAAGGALDSQVHGKTGYLFNEQSVDALCDAICQTDYIDFNPHEIRAHAARFDTSVFKREISRVVAEFQPSIDSGPAVSMPLLQHVPVKSGK